MKKLLLCLNLVVLSVICSAQANYIGQYVDEKWLDSFFDYPSYSLQKGSVDSETGYIISGEISGIHNGDATTIATSRNGRCNGISTKYSESNPSNIISMANYLLSTAGFSVVRKNCHDGKNTDEYFSLDYEGERRYGGSHLISFTISARGSYNSFGKYFPSYFRSYICCAGL